jgi:hypothetical protein
MNYKDKLKELKKCINLFFENANEDGFPTLNNTNFLAPAFIENLLKIWSIFDSLLEDGEQSTFELPVAGTTLDEKMETLYRNAYFNSEPSKHTDKLKNIVLSEKKLRELILTLLKRNPIKSPYDETIRNFLVELAQNNYLETLQDLKASDKLIEDIIGFKKTSTIGHGYIKIHSGVGFFLPGRNKYCESLIQKICQELENLHITYLVSDTVKDKCFNGLLTYSAYASRNAQPQGGGRSSRRRKAYKTTRRNTKNKNKKQYRRKRHTKKYNKSHRRSRR